MNIYFISAIVFIVLIGALSFLFLEVCGKNGYFRLLI